MLVPILPRDKLDAYRQKWTSDSEVGRKFRFQTESRLAGNAANNKFQVVSLRFMPGTPKALENYRAKLVDRFGLFAMSALKFYVSSLGESVTPGQLKAALADCGADIKPFEFNQVGLSVWSNHGSVC
jgi:hypothetical protein